MRSPAKAAGRSRHNGTGKRAENKRRTKKAILSAALELFARQGFFKTTTKEISRRARIAEGTLFNYFKTKEDLALYFLEEELSGLITWFEQEKRLRKATIAEQLFAVIHHHLERIRPYEDFIGAVYLRALQPSSKLSPLSLHSQEHNLRYLRFVRDILGEAEARGELPGVGEFGAYGFGLFHLAMITYWLQDQSPGKGQTLALLDRCLNFATQLLQNGTWQW
jgi:AcrR family transcriptional regulator